MSDSERQRLRDDRHTWQEWGPYVSERAWGTVREDYSAGRHRLGVPPARPRPLARLPLERGRPRRHLRPAPAALPRVRVLERARPDPQGADLRPDRQRGQPRRGRQGVLVVPRLHPDALVDALALRVPAGGVPLRRPRRREPPARTGGASSTSCSTPASSTTTATGTSWSTTRRPPPTTSASGCASRNAGPDAGGAPRAADTLVPQPLVVVRTASRRPELRAGERSPRGRGGAARPHGARRRRRPGRARLRQRDERRAALRRDAGARLPEGRHQRPRRRRAPPPSNPDGVGHEGRAVVPARGARRRHGRGAPAPRARTRATWVAAGSALMAAARGGGRRLLRRRSRPPRRAGRAPRDAPGVRRDAVEQAVLQLRRRALARRRPVPAAPAARPRRRDATTSGATCTPTTSSRCRTSGSTRGSPRGTSRSTPWRWRTWTRSSRRTS